jgi:hypothetical protein
VRAAIRIEETEEWIHVPIGDLSMGGAFVVTEQYIVEGTRVDIGFEFPSGTQLFFLAEIARAVPAGPQGPAGLGIRLVDPPAAALSTLALELSPRMNTGPDSAHAASSVVAAQVVPGTPVGAPPPPQPMQPPHPPQPSPMTPGTELTVTLYERLRLQPNVDDATLSQHFETFMASVNSQLAASPEGSSQQDQLLVFRSSLERLRPLSQDPMKRLAYDFHNGFIRADERVKAAESGHGPDLQTLAKAWARVKPKEVREAKRYAVQSRSAGPQAAELLAQALSLDPFNEQLLHEKQKLELKANLRAQLLGNKPTPSAEGAPAESSDDIPVITGSQEGAPVVEEVSAEPPAASEGGGMFTTPAASAEPPASEGGGMFTTPAASAEPPAASEGGGMFTTPAVSAEPPVASEGGGMFTTPAASAEPASDAPPPPRGDDWFGDIGDTAPDGAVSTTETARMYTMPADAPAAAEPPPAEADAQLSEPAVTEAEAGPPSAAPLPAASEGPADGLTTSERDWLTTKEQPPGLPSDDELELAEASQLDPLELVSDEEIAEIGDDELELLGDAEILAMAAEADAVLGTDPPAADATPPPASPPAATPAVPAPIAIDFGEED